MSPWCVREFGSRRSGRPAQPPAHRAADRARGVATEATGIAAATDGANTVSATTRGREVEVRCHATNRTNQTHRRTTDDI